MFCTLAICYLWLSLYCVWDMRCMETDAITQGTTCMYMYSRSIICFYISVPPDCSWYVFFCPLSLVSGWCLGFYFIPDPTVYYSYIISSWRGINSQTHWLLRIKICSAHPYFKTISGPQRRQHLAPPYLYTCNHVNCSLSDSVVSALFVQSLVLNKSFPQHKHLLTGVCIYFPNFYTVITWFNVNLYAYIYCKPVKCL